MYIQLYDHRNSGVELLASDGRMWVDGRLNHEHILDAIYDRNTSFLKYFPHKIAAMKYKKVKF